MGGFGIGAGLGLFVLLEGAPDDGQFVLGQGEDAGLALLTEGEGRGGVGLTFGAMAVGFAAPAPQDDQGAAQGGDGVEGDHGRERRGFAATFGDFLGAISLRIC